MRQNILHWSSILNQTKIFDELTLEIICCLMALFQPLQKSYNSRSTELPIYHPIWHFMARLGCFLLKEGFPQKTWYTLYGLLVCFSFFCIIVSNNNTIATNSCCSYLAEWYCAVHKTFKTTEKAFFALTALIIAKILKVILVIVASFLNNLVLFTHRLYYEAVLHGGKLMWNEL